MLQASIDSKKKIWFCVAVFSKRLILICSSNNFTKISNHTQGRKNMYLMAIDI